MTVVPLLGKVKKSLITNSGEARGNQRRMLPAKPKRLGRKPKSQRDWETNINAFTKGGGSESAFQWTECGEKAKTISCQTFRFFSESESTWKNI